MATMDAKEIALLCMNMDWPNMLNLGSAGSVNIFNRGVRSLQLLNLEPGSRMEFGALDGYPADLQVVNSGWILWHLWAFGG